MALTEARVDSGSVLKVSPPSVVPDYAAFVRVDMIGVG
jgi:hypothetical protein